MEKIENVPLIEDLEKFVSELRPEHRPMLFRMAEAFLCVGAMHGAFTGLASAMHTTSQGDQQKEWIAYLQKRREECAV
jgi:hypothetical protein